MSQDPSSNSIFIPNSTDDDLQFIDSRPTSKLERVRDPKHFNIEYVIFNVTLSNEWAQWWNETAWRRENDLKRVLFDSQRLKSTVWQFMRSCAKLSDGTPYVQCERCGAILVHPCIKDAGTTALSRHLKSDECRRTAKQKGKGNIEFFSKRKKVCCLLIITLIITILIEI
jgi:hypothetical protein